MESTIQLTNLIDKFSANLSYSAETKCPICKAKILPVSISGCLNSLTNASVFNFCRGCSNTFITTYAINPNKNPSLCTYSCKATALLFSEPNKFVEYSFDDTIRELSPQFVKIYNQALVAESAGLDEIAGIGYRKALEFLVKDFAIFEHPDSEESIKSCLLSSCIKNYITAENIKILSERSAWIGNDEAHYVRKQDNRDINDMKTFIQATVYFISMVLITKDAATIDPA